MISHSYAYEYLKIKIICLHKALVIHLRTEYNSQCTKEHSKHCKTLTTKTYLNIAVISFAMLTKIIPLH